MSSNIEIFFYFLTTLIGFLFFFITSCSVWGGEGLNIGIMVKNQILYQCLQKLLQFINHS